MWSGKRWVDTAKILCSVVYVGWVQVGVGVDKSETAVGGFVQTLVGVSVLCGGVRVSCGVADGGRLGKEVA